MRKVLTTTLAIASLLAISTGASTEAMAQSRYDRGNWMAAAPPGPAYGVPFNLSNRLSAYDVGDTREPFGGARPWGSAENSTSRPYYNPALDRAKGSLD